MSISEEQIQHMASRLLDCPFVALVGWGKPTAAQADRIVRYIVASAFRTVNKTQFEQFLRDYHRNLYRVIVADNATICYRDHSLWNGSDWTSSVVASVMIHNGIETNYQVRTLS